MTLVPMPVRLTCLLVALLPATLQVVAQGWEGSVKLGGASTILRGDDSDLWDRQFGFAAGSSLGYQMRNGLIPTFELAYSRMGADTRVLDVSYESDLDYLTASLLLQYRFRTRGAVDPRVFTGPAFSFLLKATETVESGGVVISAEDDTVEGSDFGFTWGGGLDFEIGSLVLTLEVRYYRGLRDIQKPIVGFGDSRYLNDSFIFLAGILF